MKIVRFIIVIIELFVCFLLSSLIKVELPSVSINPDMLLIIVITCAWMYGSNAGMIYGFISGVFLDILSGTGLGLTAFAYLIIGYVAGLCRKFYRKDDNVTPLVLTAVSDFVYLSAFYLINFSMRGRVGFGVILKSLIIPKITLTVLIAVFVFKLCQLSIGWSRRGDE